jgi:two-component system, cell cycle response regulator
MSGRILIVAEGFARAKRFEDELVAASFEVAIATSAQDCIAACAQGAVDVVLLDTVSPGSRAIELCRTLKGSAGAADLAILAVTADDAPLQRLKALDAGATECLRVPYDDGSLIVRLRNLVRSRRLADQGAGLRTGTSASRETPVRVLILDPDERSRLRLAAILAGEFQVASFSEPGPGIIQVAQGQHDLAVVSLEWETFDGFRLCRQIRLVDPTGLMPVILVTEGTDLESRQMEENGFDDWIVRPVDRSEVLARLRLAARVRALAAALKDCEDRSSPAWSPPRQPRRDRRAA